MIYLLNIENVIREEKLLCLFAVIPNITTHKYNTVYINVFKSSLNILKFC